MHVCLFFNVVCVVVSKYFHLQYVRLDAKVEQGSCYDPNKNTDVCFLPAQPPFTMCLRVKFYPPDPAALREEITR